MASSFFSSSSSSSHSHDKNVYLLQQADSVTECLKILEHKFKYQNEFYIEISPSASTLISLNPFRAMPPSNSDALFSYAQQALLNSCASSSTILVTGESGSGKTFVINKLISYFASSTLTNGHLEAANQEANSIESMLIHTNPILEAFGNASTIQNENSSRFGKYIQLEFDKNTKLDSVKLSTYLLEKTRATQLAGSGKTSTERSFHIFYQMIAGADHTERLDWHLTDQLISNMNHPTDLDRSNWQAVKQALLNCLHISQENYSNIFRLLASICHLNQSESSESFREAAHLLGFSDCGHDYLDQYVSFQVLNVNSIHETVKRLCTSTERVVRKHALIKLIYVQLFKWLVNTLNECLRKSTKSRTLEERERAQIGLLDIYGFENLETNSLEQLCINYANERLHQIYMEAHVKRVQHECLIELAEWIPLDDPANNKHLLNQIEKGLFNFINEECILRRLSYEQATCCLLSKIINAQTRYINSANAYSFQIRHYVGRVTYQVKDLIQKNKDQMPDDLLEFLMKSNNSFLVNCLPANKKIRSAMINKKRKTVMDKFKLNLNVLFARLVGGQEKEQEPTDIYYVRCIRPNELKTAHLFDMHAVKRQLLACSLHSLIELNKRLGTYYRHKFDYFKFYTKYLCIGDQIELELNVNVLRDWTESMLLKRMIHSTFTPDEFRLGKTKVFLSDSLLKQLNAAMNGLIEQSAVAIQSVWRMYLARKLFSKQKNSIIKIQKWIRLTKNNNNNINNNNNKLAMASTNHTNSSFSTTYSYSSSSADSDSTASSASTVTLVSCSSND
jgi:myosin-5